MFLDKSFEVGGMARKNDARSKNKVANGEPVKEINEMISQVKEMIAQNLGGKAAFLKGKVV